MTVLVTGATGFIGGHLVDFLLERDETVRILVQPGEDVGSLPDGSIEVCRGDLRDWKSLGPAVRGVDRVLHCAARTGPWGPAGEYAEVNVRGTQGLLEAALETGANRFLHVSSIAVHGTNVNGSADETAPLQRGSDPYSRTKVEAERRLQRMIHQASAPVTIVRPGLVYGPGDAGSFGRFAKLIEQGRMPIIGSGGNHVPLIHVSDVVRGIVLAAENAQAVGRAYLLVNDEPVTQSEYFAAIAAELGVPAPHVHVPYYVALALGASSETVGRLFRMQNPPPVMRFGIRQIGGENRFIGDRARNELGFSPVVRVREGVPQSIAWYRAQSSPGSEALVVHE